MKKIKKNKISKGGDSLEARFDDRKDKKLMPLEVKVYNNNFERAFKAFRAIVQKERILSLYKEKQSYEKPSDKKRRKKNEMRKRALELKMKSKKMISGDYEKEKLKKLKQKKSRDSEY